MKERLFNELTAAGMPSVPDEFSVTFANQTLPAATLNEIEGFIRVFEEVTTRPAWRDEVTRSRPEVLRPGRSEVCFFSAWDFHLPPGEPWQVIEFNDNGSGLLYAGLINRAMYDLLSPAERGMLVPPPTFEDLRSTVRRMVRQEAAEFFGSIPEGLFLILDDPESLERGKFLGEMEMLREVLREEGLSAEVGAVTDLSWQSERLLFASQPVAFVVNRSTDFFLETDATLPLRQAFSSGNVYIAPNPFTYATRSDKGLLEFLSNPQCDAELGIRDGERAVLDTHVPETHLLRADNIEAMVENKEHLVFKPTHSHASRGFLSSAKVGRSRLNRLLKKGAGYVSQMKVARPEIILDDGSSVWADLRVWAYRGEIVLLSGRASVRGDSLDLRPPGGWLPTFAARP